MYTRCRGDRLGDHRGDGLRSAVLYRQLEFVCASYRSIHRIAIIRQAIRVPVRNVDGTDHVWTARVGGRCAPEAHRQCRSAMVGVAACQDFVGRGLAAELLVLLGNLDGRLNGFRAAADEEDASIVAWIQSGDSLRQLDLRDGCGVGRRRLDLEYLGMHRIRYGAPAITCRLVPQAAHHVDVLVALYVGYPDSLAFNEYLESALPI